MIKGLELPEFLSVCSECRREYDPASPLWRCECGGLLDLASFNVSFPLDKIRKRPATLWRYREALPFAATYTGWQAVTMGEGLTPLVPLSVREPHVLLKVDYLMPTLSFKDRGAAVLMAKLQELGAAKVIADSSGNAGAAVAAYAARAGIECDVYVPSATSTKKVKQIAAYNAAVHVISGSREDTAKAAIAAVEQERAFYASHVYNPFFYQGTKTYAFEIWEQLGEVAPETLVLPVGNGTLLLGAYYGFKELLNLELIEKMPRFLAVQAEACAPIARAFQLGEKVAQPVVNTGTEAEGIAIAAPARSRQILAAVRDTGGQFITVPESSIRAAGILLANKGFYVEPTAAAAYAGFSEYVTHCLGGSLAAGTSIFTPHLPEESTREKIVIPLCGAGLKAQ